MNKITALIAALKLRLKDRFTPSVGTILTTLVKLEAQIEKAIDKDERTLANMEASVRNLIAAGYAKNAEVDRAYKLLNSVSGLGR